MSQTSEPGEKEEEIKLFVPEIAVKITRSGLVQVTITNMNEYWEENTFDIPIRSCLRLFYNYNYNDSFNHQENQQLSHFKTIQVGRIPRIAQFYLKLPLFLCCYKFSFCVSSFNRKSNEWMNKSKIQTIDIPSIWSLNEYKVGDKIVFKLENEAIVHNATIIEVLEDNKYKLKYKESKSLLNAKEIETTCDVSRIYEEAPNIQYTMNLMDDSDVIKYLLVKRNDEESMNIYNAIKQTLQSNKSLIFECLWMYDYGEKFLIHMEPITDFLAYNMISYLFEPQFKHKIHCLFDVHHKDGLIFVNEMQYTRQIAMELEMDVNGLNCSCDLCRTEISEWSFMFCDHNVSINQSHHYCSNCILTTILLNDALKNNLENVLEGELNKDCIEEIVHCLIGKVVYTDLESKECVTSNKRTIDNVTDLMPIAKRRKLN